MRKSTSKQFFKHVIFYLNINFSKTLILANHVAAFHTNPFYPKNINRKEQHPNFFKKTSGTILNSISDWRDLMFDIPLKDENDQLASETSIIPPREICVLPFPFSDVLLQGETKQLRLYEDRFIKLFDDSMENHCGVVAMGLLAEVGIIQSIAICEIEAYNRMLDNGMGIFVTIRVVGRASLIDLTQQEPYIKGVCVEIMDKIPPNLQSSNVAASNIENFMVTLSSMEHQIGAIQTEEYSSGSDLGTVDTADAMNRRIIDAKLDDQFYDSENDIDDDDEEEEDDDDDDVGDHSSRFKKAFKVAKDTDTQGYMVGTSSENNGNLENQRSVQDLTAISWAAFCTSIVKEEEAAYRIQALNSDDLFERLKLATYMLRVKKDELQKQLNQLELKRKRNDDSSNAED